MEKLKGMQTNDKERASNHFLHPYFGPVKIKRGGKVQVQVLRFDLVLEK